MQARGKGKCKYESIFVEKYLGGCVKSSNYCNHFFFFFLFSSSFF